MDVKMRMDEEDEYLSYLNTNTVLCCIICTVLHTVYDVLGTILRTVYSALLSVLSTMYTVRRAVLWYL